MTDDPAARTHESRRLRSKLRFSTYSDARLAALFLDNDFPIILFTKVFDVIRDPAFNSSEVTFGDVWDMFIYISSRRKKDALTREVAAPATPPEPTEVTHVSASSGAGVVPPLILELVVDRFMPERTPLGVAAMDPWWSNAFEANLEPFHNLSLVHRSWTCIAQRGLRHRVVVPYERINRFLMSPFCGPWINEMILYWSVDNDNVGVTKDDIWLLEALLERTPNVRSLAFVSSISWPKGYLQPSFDVDICLEIISDLLPDLENLWLKHIPLPIDDTGQLRAEVCGDLRTLCQRLPKMRSLKFLSLRSWNSEQYGNPTEQPELDWNDHPPSQLTTLELDLRGPEKLSKDDLMWLVKPRDKFCLQSISFRARYHYLRSQNHKALRDSLRTCIPELKELRLCITGIPYSSGGGFPVDERGRGRFYTDLLVGSRKLTQLDLFVIDMVELPLSKFFLPPCLEQLAIHFHDTAFRRHMAPEWPGPKYFVDDVIKLLPSLRRLRSIIVTGSRELPSDTVYWWDLDALVHHKNENPIPYASVVTERLADACRERNIQLTVVTNAFHRRWDIPRGDETFQSDSRH